MDSAVITEAKEVNNAYVNQTQAWKHIMIKKIALRSLNRVLLLLLGYILYFFNVSLTLPIIAVLTLAWFENVSSNKSRKISSKSTASSMSKKDILKSVDELPSWVVFPDRERAEWLNEIIEQLWPSISSYLVKVFRSSLQTKIRKKFESFRFEDIDFGTTPPKIDGVKVYKKSITKDSIIIDFDIYYDGDCDIKFSMSGAHIGRIRDFQLGAELRVVLKPLMIKVPIIGGVQIFLLNTPDINFDLEGISGIPGFSYFIRQKIEERITKKFVFPNKITKRFSKSIEAAELKSLEPAGVLRVHVFEAKNLERKDVTGKSDPYVVLNIGAQEHKTQVINRELNPKWDYWCEFVILDPYGQHLQFKVFDQDELNEDDFLGSGLTEIHTVVREGENDRWFQLDHVKHGSLHLRFTWLELSSERRDLEAASQESTLLKVENINTALLTVYLDMARDLEKVKSRKPSAYAILTVGKNQQKSKVKKHTCDPIWEEGFFLLVHNPDNDSLNMNIIDKSTDTKLGHFTYNIRNLFDMPDLQISKQVFPLVDSGKITISLQLRILSNALFEVDESDSDSDEDVLLRDTISSRNLERTASIKQSRSSKTVYKTNTPPTTPHPKVEDAKKVVEDFLKKSSTVTHTVMKSPTFRVKPDMGQIELTLFYSALRQKLVVTVHRITNLPLKDPSDIPDPYVKLRLISPGSCKLKNKTKVVTDNCDPVFEETFEYLLSETELPFHKLIVTVKSKKVFFNSNAIGQVVIDFKNFRDLQEPIKEWFELAEPEDSD